MWKFIVDVVHDFVSSLQPDVGRGFLHVSNVFLFLLCFRIIISVTNGVDESLSGQFKYIMWTPNKDSEYPSRCFDQTLYEFLRLCQLYVAVLFAITPK